MNWKRKSTKRAGARICLVIALLVGVAGLSAIATQLWAHRGIQHVQALATIASDLELRSGLILAASGGLEELLEAETAANIRALQTSSVPSVRCAAHARALSSMAALNRLQRERNQALLDCIGRAAAQVGTLEEAGISSAPVPAEALYELSWLIEEDDWERMDVWTASRVSGCVRRSLEGCRALYELQRSLFDAEKRLLLTAAWQSFAVASGADTGGTGTGRRRIRELVAECQDLSRRLESLRPGRRADAETGIRSTLSRGAAYPVCAQLGGYGEVEEQINWYGEVMQE